MENKFNNISFICNILNKNKVEYLIIGGVAVGLHGYIRYTTNLSNEIIEKEDIDILYNPTYKNYSSLLNALKDFGQDISVFEAEQAPNPKKSFFKFDFPDFTLDFLPKLATNISFSDLFQRRELLNIEGIEISFLGYEDLIINKKFTARAKDLNDIKELEKIKNSK